MSFPEPLAFSELASSQDKAFQLAHENSLPVWGSVIAAMQTAGRGQTRKKWVSLPGNLFASLRLPAEAPFSKSQAAIACAALVITALNSMGHDIRLKWPNDPVICRDDVCRKCGGILVEEKNGIIIAGIGLNLNKHPQKVELESGFLPPCAIQPEKTFANPEKFWLNLLAAMLVIYENGASYARRWQTIADSLLVWKGKKILATGEQKSGILKGIAQNGALILEEHGNLQEIVSGGIILA